MVLMALLACASEVAVYERPVVVASAREIDFGSAASGDAVQRTLTLRNDGELPFGIAWAVQLEDGALGGGFLAETPAPGTLVAAGESIDFDVWFTPQASRNEDVLFVDFFEDETTAWYDRAHTRMGIRLSGAGTDLPTDTGAGPLVGGVIPEATGLEPGDHVVLSVRPVGPLTSEWDADEGTLDATDAYDVVYTAPDSLPCEGIACLVRFSYTGTDGSGNQAWDFGELTLWEEGELREPVLVEP